LTVTVTGVEVSTKKEEKHNGSSTCCQNKGGSMLRKTIVLPVVAVALLLSPILKADSHDGFEKASVLLERVETNAIDVRHDAARLKTFMRFPGQHSWQIHAAELGQIRERVNEIGELMSDFKSIRGQASDRQNKAFNAAVIKSAELADVTESAIRMVNQDKQKVEMAYPDYESKVTKIYDLADHVVAAIGFAESWDEVIEARKMFSKN
jgi:hypothetical protein